LDKPIVWTFHDMWAFTGGCHYVGDCKKFLAECGNCPALKLSSEKDISNKIFNHKRSIFKKLNLTIVTTSRWLASEASRSKLLEVKRVHIIPTPIDSQKYRPIDRNLARERLRLSSGRKIILFGAMNLNDERKGFHYLIEALKVIKTLSGNSEIELAVFGKLDEGNISRIPFKVNQLGQLKTEDEIVAAYNSADVFVAPSLEDNLPNTIMESMACGTPVVAFGIGGISDMVDNGKNGILTKLKSVEELAGGILKIISDDDLQGKMSIASREKILNAFDQASVVRKYKELYNNLIQNLT